MQRFSSLRWRIICTGLAVAACATVASQPSAASMVTGHRSAAITLAGGGAPLGDTAAATTHCNGPTFSPPTSANTTNAGTASFLALAAGAAAPNLWNVKKSAGSIEQCYNADSGFTDSVNLTSLSLGPTDGPAGFPEIGYGESAYGQTYCGANISDCKKTPFPIPVSSFSKDPYLVKLSYSLGTISPAQYWHLTFDLWLEQSVSNSGPKASDVEVLIEPYNTYPACGTAKPAFTTSGATWDVYEGCGASKATALHFVLKSPAQRKTDTMTVNLSSFVAEVRKLLPGDTSLASKKMAGIEVGMEFDNYNCIAGRCSAQASSAKFRWAVSSLSLTQLSSTSKIYHVVG